MDIYTQLGGSYQPNNTAIFEVKKKLEAAGIYVRQPMGESMFLTSDGKALGFNPVTSTIKQVELDLFRSIASCDLHIVCNEESGKARKIGSSTAIGILYAILKSKPIIFLHNPQTSAEVESQTADIIGYCTKQFNIYDPRQHNHKTNQMNILRTVHKASGYDLNSHQRAYVRQVTQDAISQLL